MAGTQSSAKQVAPRLCLLGAFRFEIETRPIRFPTRKDESLLAYLALFPGPHAREKLAGLLWGDSPDVQARHSLRTALATLRKHLGEEFLLTERETVQVNPAYPLWVDALELEKQINQFTAKPPPDPSRLSLALYQGDLLADFYDEWITLERERYRALYLDASSRLAEYWCSHGEYERTIEVAQRILISDPGNEQAHRHLMFCYLAVGQRGVALQQYQDCVRVLHDELGVEPSQETTALYESIRDGTLDKSIAAIRLYPPVSFAQEEPPAPGKPPFKGLCYFDEVDADLFFGREALTAKLVRRVCEFLSPASGEASGGRFLAVVGASGSGKSSLVRAGLVPALKRGVPLTDDTLAPDGGSSSRLPFRGPIHVITPTAHPLEALAVSLTREAESVTATATLMDDLARDPRSLHLAVLKRLSGDAHHFLLVVDQFEELFSLCRSDAERKVFVDNLLFAAGSLPLSSGGSVGDEGGPTLVVITLRADFYAHCAPFDDLRLALCQGQEYIGPMSVEEMRRAIEEPARRGGWTFEGGLVDLLLREAGAGEEPGALPLLSHALLETWQRRRGRTLTFAGYAESGGVHGAIAKTAETVYQQLAPRQRTITRNIFLRLTELGEGTQDTRRRAALAELVTRPEDTPAVEAVVRRLADARLVTTAEGTAEVAHEALIREWGTLREWLSENREGLKLHRHLTQAAQEWDRLNRDADALYRGARLAQALEWADAHADDLNMLERAFLDASLAERQAREAEEAARQRREAKAQQERQRQRRVIGVGAVLLFIVAIAALLIFQQKNIADAERVTAVWARATSETLRQLGFARELAYNAVVNLDTDPERGVLLALQSLRQAYTAEGEDALRQALLKPLPVQVLRGHTARLNDVAFSPDGKQLVSVSDDGTARFWDVTAGRLITTLSDFTTDWITSVAFSPDGKQTVIGDYNGNVRVWDLAANAYVRALYLPIQAASVAYSPDGRYVGVGSHTKAHIWDDTGNDVVLQGHTAIVSGIAFSPDGSQVATSSWDGSARLWDVKTGRESKVLVGHTGYVTRVAYSPDGKRIVTAGQDGTARIWDVASGHEVMVLRGHYAQLESAVYSPDGQQILTSSDDATARIWDASTGRELAVLRGHTGTVERALYSSDGKQIATGSDDGTVRIWSTSPSGESSVLRTNAALPYAAFSAMGEQIATTSEEGGIRMWDRQTGQPIRLLSSPAITTPAASVAYSPDGKWIVAAYNNGDAYVWDTERMTPMKTFTEHRPQESWSVHRAIFSPDSKQVMVAGGGPETVLCDAITALPTTHLVGHSSFVIAAAYSPDGKQIATASDDTTVRIWDASTGNMTRVLPGNDLGRSVAFSPDGRQLASGWADNTIRVWDVTTGLELMTLRGHASWVESVVFSPDGRYILSGSLDGTARLWDSATGREVMTLRGHTGGLTNAVFSPDGKYILTSSDDGTARVYLTHIQDLAAVAQSRVTRALTTDECRKYLHVEACPTAP